MPNEIIKRIFSRNPPSIIRKKESYFMYLNSLLGNKPRTWESYEDLMKDNYSGQIVIRSKKGISRSTTRYNVEKNKIKHEILELGKKGLVERELNFAENMPDKYISIQGEVMRNSEGLYLHYSELKLPMNIALKKDPKNAIGLTAKLILQKKMPTEDYLILEDFLNKFPNDIVEFSTWTKAVGTLQKHTIIWEIRNY